MNVYPGGMSGRRGLIAAAVLVAFLAGVSAPAAAAADNRELQAREAFAAGRFQDALDLFAKLYAETLHPTYQRNIGRCYQNLGDPDKAIISFREYLRQARNVRKSERDEVEGYIKEMEALKREREATGASRPEPVKTEPAPPPPPPFDGTVGARPVAEQQPLVLKETRQPDDQARPIYGRWWFWAIVGGVALAGGVGLFAATRSGKSDPACGDAGRVCR
jgi:tetratricopeptide (TPR) repeat protein